MPCLTGSTGGDVLWEAWERVRRNRGAAGVDRVTLAFVEETYGVGRMLAELQCDLRAGSYPPAPARRVDIPKPAGGSRPLGIPTVRDRVAQAAAKIVLEPIFEADFASCSYGFRPKRSAVQAKEAIRVASSRDTPRQQRPISGTSLAPSTMTGSWWRWHGGFRIGGCSSWSACGFRPGC
jgi:retron-type reverse transcriptase